MRFTSYQKRLFGYALALCRDRELASEIVQDCVVRAMTASRVPCDEPAYRAWLFTIVRNLWRDHLRKKPSRADIETSDTGDLGMAPFAHEETVINVIAVRQALEQLPIQHRDILALVDIAGFGYAEAAAILGIPEGTAMSRISRARSALAARLRDAVVVQLPTTYRQGMK